jgi:hypothetical protein
MDFNNIDIFLFNSITNAKALSLARNGSIIYVKLPNNKTVKAKALSDISSTNVAVVKEGTNYYCFSHSSPVMLSQSIKAEVFNVKRPQSELIFLFLLIDISNSLQNKGVLKAIQYLESKSPTQVKIITFSSYVGFISDVLNKSDALALLQYYYDNFNPNYFDIFYHFPGSSLEENGIAAIDSALSFTDTKYKNQVYLVTDNDEFYGNSINPSVVLQEINSKLDLLVVDITSPLMSLLEIVPEIQEIDESTDFSSFTYQVYTTNQNFKSVYVANLNDNNLINFPAFNGQFNVISHFSYTPLTTGFYFADVYGTGDRNGQYLGTLCSRISPSGRGTYLIHPSPKIIYSPQAQDYYFSLNPPSTPYQTALPPSSKIVYL